jgi:hypothetical protein
MNGLMIAGVTLVILGASQAQASMTASRSIEPGCTIASTTDADVSGDGPVDEAPSLSSASSTHRVSQHGCGNACHQ